ncbi:Dam family site-specific DNA-(adenine-N6)-methyltransferase [Gimesia chilikensis]|uniref:Site-specific DNA-methyltransferase (adenine-specific) n=1 Tax=Gimesia chilikensis TaxID=2605989 RepID=A0A517PY69_9PLAN|nr:Dam family site-specific DNA-(adenine-N6)-methyltransferase [Gimesia chilikensis]QDT24337.1 Modification methylase DpnIIA [Gimesia chilikensis]
MDYEESKLGQREQNNTLEERNGYRRAETFRQNFRSLLESRWLSQREAADQIGVPYKWVRRLCHEGVGRADKRTKAGLQDIASFFGVEVEALWQEKVVSSSIPRPDRSLIRWTGTKRLQAGEIVKRFPNEIATYYEPFLGGGAVLYELLKSDIPVKRFRCSDTCAPLIELWKQIRSDPATLQKRYEVMWNTLRRRGKNYYLEVRDLFNESHDPCDFFFVLRTCRNGFVRFNQKGKFTVGFHHKRNGLPPEEVHALLQDWHRLLMKHDVTFTVRDYREISTRLRDVIYLDPPYVAETEIYSGRFDYGELWTWMERQRCSYLLSLNGFVGSEDRRLAVPNNLYDEELQIDAGIGSLNTNGSIQVTNSLYLRTSKNRG